MQSSGRAAASLAALLAGALPAFAADMDEKLAPCLACHGAQGQSELENVPSLGAQTAPYTVIQLVMFRPPLWIILGQRNYEIVIKEHLGTTKLRKLTFPQLPRRRPIGSRVMRPTINNCAAGKRDPRAFRKHLHNRAAAQRDSHPLRPRSLL